MMLAPGQEPVFGGRVQPDPAQIMKEGATHLLAALEPLGFRFRIVRTGTSSGGTFCEAELVRDDRRIELHFRWMLGIVRYHIGDVSASHEVYVEALGRRDESQFPRDDGDPIESFERLARDLALIRGDFLEGNGDLLARAAAIEARRRSEAQQQHGVDAAGDRRNRRDAREAFRAQRFADVVRLLEGLRYPEDLSPAERELLRIARSKL